ncbi:MAG TPA: glycosyltransferase family 2 protein [Gemmataceae bacterium]|jgi:dolichol-phosphate mannosyltransferase|nr:glycosyltransferase family 2 protein [Gemmataceae bacterium]
MTARLSLVMPAYNEAAGIADAIAEAHEALAGLGYEFEILVVDDGSTDGTAERVGEMAALWPHVRLVSHSMNLGYGAALRSGFEASRYDLVAFTDADGQFFLEDIDELVVRSDDFPVAVGWRIDRKDPWRRRFLSWGYNVLARAILGTGVRDCDCALKVFRREALAYLLPDSAGFFVNSEMLSKARQFGFAVVEIGVRHRARRSGTSKVSLWEVPKTFSNLMRFWWRQVVWTKPMAVPQFADPVVLPFPRTASTTHRKAA